MNLVKIYFGSGKWTWTTDLSVMSAFATSVVQVSMVDDNGEMRFILDKVKVPAGSITFKATNNSNADMLHEMLILKVDSDNTNLPYDENTGRVLENKIPVIAEIPEIDPGKSRDLTLNLEKGKYLLFCNIAGHYASGMKIILNVQ